MKYKTVAQAVVFAGVLLVSSTSHAGPIRTLFLGADENLNKVLNDIVGADSRFDLANSATFDARTTMPMLSYLQQFDSVLYWTNWYPDNAVGYGNLLADYVDAGGLVVRATFVGQTVPTHGRIGSSSYAPFAGGGGAAYASACLGSKDATSAIMAGVSSLCGSTYRGDWGVELNAGATLVASWNDGSPFVGINASQNVIDISLFPNVAQYGHATGDYRQLFANALAFNEEAAPVPEPAGTALIGLGLLGMGAARLRRKR